MEKEIKILVALWLLMWSCTLKKEKLADVSPDNLIYGVTFKINDNVYVSGYSSDVPIQFPSHMNAPESIPTPLSVWLNFDSYYKDTSITIAATCYLYQPIKQSNVRSSNVSIKINVKNFRGKGYYNINNINSGSSFEEYGRNTYGISGMAFIDDGSVSISEFDWKTLHIRGTFNFIFKDSDGNKVQLKDGFFIKP